jgi:hypothetical protein
MIAFVGLKTVAIAANPRAILMLEIVQSLNIETKSAITHLAALELGCFGSLRIGHNHNATVVSVVSSEFDRVLVEQNHCHGLKTVKKSYIGDEN